MSEESRGIGANLKAAREEKGWTTQDVSTRLRLTSRQIEAIEAEEFPKLGPPVFARGFVRNYARLVGLDPDDLLDQMTRIRTSPIQDTENVPFTPGQEFWKSPWVLGAIVVVFLLIAIPVGLYLWLSSDEEEKAAPAVEQQLLPPPPPPAPELQEQPAPAAESPTEPAAPVAPQAAPAQPPKAPAPAAPQVEPAPSPSTAPAAPSQPAPATVAPTPGTSASLHLQFDAASWVRVHESGGRIVHSGLNPAGSTLDLDGRAPFVLIVGNAEHVHLNYRGQPVDLKPFTSVNVARLTLNQ